MLRTVEEMEVEGDAGCQEDTRVSESKTWKNW